jgi:hypothetical protein
MGRIYGTTAPVLDPTPTAKPDFLPILPLPEQGVNSLQDRQPQIPMLLARRVGIQCQLFLVLEPALRRNVRHAIGDFGSVTEVTVAERGSSVSIDISPKKSPANNLPIASTRCSDPLGRETSSSPSDTRNIEFPASPILTILVPGGYCRMCICVAIIFNSSVRSAC